MVNADVIQLGDLMPNTNAVMSVILSVKAGTSVSTQVAGCIVSPTTFVRDGEQILTIGMRGDRLKPDDMLMGQITLDENGTKRKVWLVGQILNNQSPRPAAKGVLCLRMGRVRFYCHEALELSAARLNVFLSDANTRFENGVLLLARSNPKSADYFALISQTTPPQNATLNSVPLLRWSRRLLQPGQRLVVNGLEFQAEDQAKVPLGLDKHVLDFGTLKRAGQQVDLTLKNHDQMFAQVKVITTVPWLEVSQPNLSIGGGQSGVLSVSLNASALRLQRGRYEEHSALWLVIREDVIPVSVLLNVEQIPVVPEIQPAIIRLKDAAVGQVAGIEGVFEISNLGGSPWNARITTGVNWLSAEPAGSFVVPPQGKQTVKLITTAAANQLPAGVPPNVEVKVDGPEASITARVVLNVLAPPKPTVFPRLTASMEMLRFPEYRPGDPLPSSTLELKNEGEGAWEGPIHARVPWLKVTPNRGKLAPGEQLKLKVEVTSAIEQESGMLTPTKALQIVGNDQNLLIGAWINVLPGQKGQAPPAPTPQPAPPAPAPPSNRGSSSGGSVLLGVVISPEIIELGNGVMPAQAIPPAVLRISTAMKQWRCKVVSQHNFLEIQPQDTVIVTGGQPPVEVRVSLRPNSGLPAGKHELADAIMIEGENGLRFGVGVRLHLAAAP